MRGIALLFGLVLAIHGTAFAGPIYSLAHQADAYNNGPVDYVGPQATPIDYDFEYQPTYFTGANYGEVHANVNPGSIGITAHTYNIGVYAPQRQEVTATFTFDVLFSSPGTENINVVMNMDLSGYIGVPDFYATVFVNAGITGNAAGGTYTEYAPTSDPPVARSGMLSGFTADGTTHSVSTHSINVPVNVPVTMFMRLGTIQAYTPAGLTIGFGNTFSLATSGNVFDISGPNAEFVTVNSEDANIVDNQFTDVTAVPEPSSMAMLMSMLVCGVGFYGRRSIRRRR